MSNMKLGIQAAFINLTADYNYKFAQQIDRQDIRTKQGGLYTYIEQGTFIKFKIPSSWVTSSDRSLVNSWWSAGTTLRLLENDDFPSSYYLVRIVSVEEPFQTFTKPYFQQYYEGEIILETI